QTDDMASQRPARARAFRSHRRQSAGLPRARAPGSSCRAGTCRTRSNAGRRGSFGFSRQCSIDSAPPGAACHPLRRPGSKRRVSEFLVPILIDIFMCRTDNYGYLVHDVDSRRTASIDAPDAKAIKTALEKRGWDLTD